MSGINRIVRAAAIATVALGLSDVLHAQDDTGAMLDSATALVPLEPDERPDRDEIPQPAPAPTTEPTEEKVEEPTDPAVKLFERATAPLTDRGITPSISLTMDWSKNLRGGVNTEGTNFAHLLNVNFTVDTKKLLNIDGGTAFVNFQQQHGESGSVDAGDFQGISSIDAEGRTQISELWYEQQLFEEKVRIKAGKLDVGGEFGFAQNAAEFVNTSISFIVTNEVMPTYPDPALGLELFYKPCEAFNIGGGIFDGALQEGVRIGENSPHTAFGKPADLFMIAEAGLLWDKSGRTGKLAIGVWHHTGTFAEINGGDTTDGASGFYCTLDQTLIRENPDDKDDAQGLGAFIVYDHAQESVIEINHHIGAGLAYTGLLPKRDDDVVGLGATWVHFSDGAGFAHESETTVEGFYKIQVTPWFAVQPDLQYVIDPGFAMHDALVGTLRMKVEF